MELTQTQKKDLIWFHESFSISHKCFFLYYRSGFIILSFAQLCTNISLPKFLDIIRNKKVANVSTPLWLQHSVFRCNAKNLNELMKVDVDATFVHFNIYNSSKVLTSSFCMLIFKRINCKTHLLFCFFKCLAVNGLPTSQSVTNSKDSPKLSNHECKDSIALDKPSSVTVTPDQALNNQLVPLLPSTTVLSSEEAPTTVCGHLQLLFAQLQYSFRRSVHVCSRAL